MSSKKWLLLFIQVGFYAAVIWFVSQKFNQLADSVDIGLLVNKPILLIFSIACFLLFYGLLSLHWKRICDQYAKFPQHHQWLSFFASQPYKYLPSSIFTFSSRGMYAKKLGLPVKQSSVVQLIENFNVQLAGLSVALVFLCYRLSTMAGVGVSALFILGLIAISFIPTFKLPKTALEISGQTWAKLFVLPVLGWLAAGTGFYLVVMATGQQIEFTSAVAANTVAVSLGILAIFAPGGIGVREFVYNKFSVGNTGIILWRLLTLILDVVIGVIAICWINHLLKKGDQSV